MVSDAVRSFQFPPVDVVVGIATGGTVPAAIVAHQLQVPMYLVHLNFRDEANTPRYERPLTLAGLYVSLAAGTRILLVDDVAVSGKTIEEARKTLSGIVHTFVLKGKADYVLFPDIRTCVAWPWKI
jgi:hypoxanthine phosphoribosyltransferase